MSSHLSNEITEIGTGESNKKNTSDKNRRWSNLMDYNLGLYLVIISIIISIIGFILFVSFRLIDYSNGELGLAITVAGLILAVSTGVKPNKLNEISFCYLFEKYIIYVISLIIIIGIGLYLIIQSILVLIFVSNYEIGYPNVLAGLISVILVIGFSLIIGSIFLMSQCIYYIYNFMNNFNKS